MCSRTLLTRGSRTTTATRSSPRRTSARSARHTPVSVSVFRTALSRLVFRQGSALHRWFCFTMSGGLNMQIEHHLFPTVCHCHLRAIKPIVVRRRLLPRPPTALPNASLGFADASLQEAWGSVRPVARLQRCVPEALLPHGSHVRATSGGEAEGGEGAVSKNVGCTSMGER